MMKNEAGVIIEEMLCQLADTTRINGEIWRAAYTPEDKIAKNILREWIENLGLEYREDAIGNVYGRLPGTEPGTVLTGSHLDTVKNGGKYDGTLGVVTGVAALGYLKQSGFVPKHSLEVVGLMEEEGSRFSTGCQGSRAICGTLKEEDLKEVGCDGVTLREALLSAGYQPEALKSVKRDDIRAIVELHIEQGPVLESEQKQIGIVDSIVGIVNYELTIHGSQNHAGTTSMPLRHDPVVAAAEFITESTRQMMAEAPSATLTYGAIQVFPGMQNVIADRVNLRIDMRDGSEEELLHDEAILKHALESIESKGFKLRLGQNHWLKSAKMDPNVIQVIEQHCEEKHLAYKHMNSGAGHDSMVFGKHFPTAMIFVPSIAGISHNPAEATAVSDIQTGFELLCDVLKELSAQTI
ncbi:MAG: M20 family metallo-hydrolase [Clostridiaceae bacterium]|nr:M20 family metallo-hydrolase [Clostridiaceae bacterium]